MPGITTCTWISCGSLPRARGGGSPGPWGGGWCLGARALWPAPPRRLGDADAGDPRVFAVHAYADPIGHAPGVLARLVGEEDPDADAARFFGPAALVVGAFDLGSDLLATAVDGLRTQGRLGYLPRLLSLYAGMAARL